jgi:hypothetical protein
MVIYSVCCKVNKGVAKEWQTYFMETHLDDVLNTGCFTGYEFRKEEGKEEGSITFLSEYHCPSLRALSTYNRRYAPVLKEDILSKFSGQFTAERNIYNILVKKIKS